MPIHRRTLQKPAQFRRISWVVTAWAGLCVALWTMGAVAQQGNNQPVGGNLPNALVVPGSNSQEIVAYGGPDANDAGAGGGANADFDSLIDLIQSTVAAESWQETAGGPGEIRPFVGGGVLVDAAGTLRLKNRRPTKSSNGDLLARRGAAPANSLVGGDPRQASPLRYISLPRLEREIARRQAAREPLDVTMLTLAGLQRVRYVFVYPESGDLVLAGPAGDWRLDDNDRIVSRITRQPVVRLDDLLALLRRGVAAGDSYFGCSINPRQEALAKTQAFLDESGKRPLEPGQRRAWLASLRDTVGTQDIEIFGVDPTSRVARVLVEADYHMKLIGMGLEDGVEGVQSYLASIRVANGQTPPPMSVLRWWFTLNYDAIRTSPNGDAFELVGQGVRVLSENELLAAQGQRVHTGQSDPLNMLFAERFTTHFAALADRYPIYAELRNVFDLAMAMALVQSEGLAKRVNWVPALMVNAEQLRLPKRAVPRQVETVINHRIIQRRHVVAGVSGGVMVAAKDVLRDGRTTDDAEQLVGRHRAPGDLLPAGAWWWDGPAE